MLKLYGLNLSAWSNRARFTINRLGLDYEYIPVNLGAGQGQSEDYLKIHPAGKVPAIDDDGFVLFESGAITRYLAAKHESGLYPADLKERALVDQWTCFVVQHIAKAMERVLFNRVVYRIANAEQDQRSLQEGLKFLQRFLPVVNARLGTSTFLAGDALSLADMALLAWLDPVEACDIDLTPYTAIVPWRDSLKQEAFYTACHKDYRDLLQAVSA